MNKRSKKGQQMQQRIIKTYQIMAESKEHKCTGCGRYYNQVPLSHSHIIPRSRRPDLAADFLNVTYHCMSMGGNIGCHDVWDNGSPEEKKMLLDYNQNMKYIESVDQEYYNLLKLKEINYRI